MFKDFSEIMQTTEAKNAVEVAQSYKLGFRFKNLMGYAERIGETEFFNSTSNVATLNKGANSIIHSHPYHAFPSNTDLSSINRVNANAYIYFQLRGSNARPELYYYNSKYYRYLY
jgi:proteasome lid subunit RPN8/RPN11